MSKKSKALAHLLIETARASFQISGEHRLLAKEWTHLSRNPETVKMIIGWIREPSGMFSKRSSSDPTVEDFQQLGDEFVQRLGYFERLNEIKAVFHAYEVEVLLYGDDMPGLYYEGVEEDAWERLVAHIDETS